MKSGPRLECLWVYNDRNSWKKKNVWFEGPKELFLTFNEILHPAFSDYNICTEGPTPPCCQVHVFLLCFSLMFCLHCPFVFWETHGCHGCEYVFQSIHSFLRSHVQSCDGWSWNGKHLCLTFVKFAPIEAILFEKVKVHRTKDFVPESVII